ncbi:hypothetical protein ACIQUS_22425 [Pseudomonas sp. NPDC090755]|uniref:hypothetical protein n=1 Tax=Pseudomonas sp. NPDC090755 TaxID=3364481 RepID=UPI00383A3D09
MTNKAAQGLRTLSAVLMFVSAITHLSQVLVYGFALNVLGAASFGVIYLAVALYLLKPGTLGLWLGAYLPMVGGILGAARYLLVHNNPFSLFHIGIDLIVVPSCLYLLLREFQYLRRIAESSKGCLRT